MWCSRHEARGDAVIPALVDLPGGLWSERKEALRKLLLYDRPLPEGAARRAFADDRFASLLLLSRGSPPLLLTLLRSPANRPYAKRRLPGVPAPIGLALKATASLARWAAGGFETLPAEAVDARLDVCRTCPMLGPPPETMVYGLKLSTEIDMSVCRACGCVVRRKAKLPHERCPQGRWPDAAQKVGAMR
ncbi:MAG TPA: hypothetical protein VES64_09895 [Allosphingosinicella sp.]|nr:hypothetical protein [Allosphingosinicella sp.]